MATKTRQFLGSTIKSSDLNDFIGSTENITTLKVGERLKVALLLSDDYNERAGTLLGHQITWIPGNVITVVTTSPAKKYSTVNLEPGCMEKVRRLQASLRLDTGERFSLSEAIETAIDSMGVK